MSGDNTVSPSKARLSPDERRAQVQANVRNNAQKQHESVRDTKPTAVDVFQEILVSNVKPNPNQPRKVFDQKKLDELRESIRKNGVMQPIKVRLVDGIYEIVMGESRWRSCVELEIQRIPALITNCTATESVVYALAENIARSDLTDFEIWQGLVAVENAYANKEELAVSVGIPRTDLYKYYAFARFPTKILDDLRQQPKLMSRSAASEINTVFNRLDKFIKDGTTKFTFETANNLFLQAWDLLLVGRIEQTKIAGWLTDRIFADDIAVPKSPNANAHSFKLDGKSVGSFIRNGSKLTLKLNTEVLDDSRSLRLQKFVEELLNETTTQ